MELTGDQKEDHDLGSGRAGRDLWPTESGGKYSLRMSKLLSVLSCRNTIRGKEKSRGCCWRRNSVSWTESSAMLLFSTGALCTVALCREDCIQKSPKACWIL